MPRLSRDSECFLAAVSATGGAAQLMAPEARDQLALRVNHLLGRAPTTSLPWGLWEIMRGACIRSEDGTHMRIMDTLVPERPCCVFFDPSDRRDWVTVSQGSLRAALESDEFWGNEYYFTVPDGRFLVAWSHEQLLIAVGNPAQERLAAFKRSLPSP